MPFPLHITWFQADRGAINFEGISLTHRPIPVHLIDSHQEVLRRPEPSTFETDIGVISTNYLLKRSNWIQERLLNLYVTAVRGGISNQGNFYGVFQQHNLVHEMDGVRLDGEVVFLTDGPTHLTYRIGLLYTPETIAMTPVSDAEVERRNLPIQMLPRHAKRDMYDHGAVPNATPEPPRRSRYDRDPVI